MHATSFITIHVDFSKFEQSKKQDRKKQEEEEEEEEKNIIAFCFLAYNPSECNQRWSNILRLVSSDAIEWCYTCNNNGSSVMVGKTKKCTKGCTDDSWEDQLALPLTAV